MTVCMRLNRYAKAGICDKPIIYLLTVNPER